MANNVIVEYSDFSKDNSKVEKITFDLLPNTELNLVQETPASESEEAKPQLTISMVNKGTDEVEISGTLDDETLNALIRSLTIFRTQLHGQPPVTTRSE